MWITALSNSLCEWFQIHWLAVNGRTELLHSLFEYGNDVDVEVSFIVAWA